jgi:serine/threonine-protein kinase
MVMGHLKALSPPRTLGDMTLLAKLGEGGMAKVYFAAVGRGDLARPAAVKLLRADLPDHDYRTRFLDEAKVVVRLHHNNLVDVRNAGELDGQLYIAMEAIEGRDLADIWDRCADLGKAFPVPLAVYMVREVLRGLHYAHSFPGLSLVHRDVSPSNILIDWAGAVRLADFGLATSTLKAALTVPGVVFGKVGYMSPEQALREPLDGRADVYACPPGGRRTRRYRAERSDPRARRALGKRGGDDASTRNMARQERTRDDARDPGRLPGDPFRGDAESRG